MKLTVLSILILLLVAGLAMIQMDGNTENQIQVLRETEMLTTQGLGDCEEVVNSADVAGNCGSIPCTPAGNIGSVYYYYKQTAIAYDKCDGFNPYNTTDCVLRKDISGNTIWQPCAELIYYSWHLLNGCDEMYRDYSYKIQVEDVSNVPGCWEVDIPVSGTSS